MTAPTPTSAIDVAALSPAEQRALLARLLSEKAERSKQFPMSAGQQGLWHAFRRNPNDTAFNVFLPTRVRAPIEASVFQESIDWLAGRHACLRTTFSDSDGQLTQRVHDELKPEFTVRPMLGADEDTLQQVVIEETLRPFDLHHGPLLRLILFQRAHDDWIILAITHHIVVDFWSLVLILQEMRAAIPSFAAGNAPRLPPAPANYSEFVRQQTELLDGSRGSELKDYWKRVASSGDPILNLPLDRGRPAAFSGRAATAVLNFSPDVTRRVVELASQTKSTTFAVVHAALQILISRYTDQKTFYIGSPFSGRTQHKFEQTVGFFVNMLPALADLNGDPSFVSVIERTSATLFKALENEAYPISRIVQDAGIPRDPSRSPLFQVSLTYEKAQLKEETGRASFLFPDQRQVWEFGGYKQESYYVPHQTCHYDLEFVLEHSGDRMRGIIVYCRDLFDAATIECMSANFSALLESLVAAPTIPITTVAWAAPGAPPAAMHIGRQPDSRTQGTAHAILSSTESRDSNASNTVVRLIQSAAERVPHNVALQLAGQTTSYSELLEQADRIAEALGQQSVGVGEMIPVVANKGPEAFVAMLGVQSFGAAPVPVDVAQTAVDLVRLAQDTAASAVLCDQPHACLAQMHLPCIFVEDISRRDSLRRQPSASSDAQAIDTRGPRGEDLAYVIYTSGSTGQPKGVMVEHRAVYNTLAWRMRDVPLASNDRVLLLLSHQFDAGLGIAWTTLSQGAALIFPDSSAAMDPTQLIDQIVRDRITVLPAVPSLLRMLAEHERFHECTSLRAIWLGGEAMPPSLPQQICRTGEIEIWNFYGPTETAIEATACKVTQHDPSRPVPIGKPIANTQILILDANQAILPAGIPGEIAVAGAGLARGYLNDSDLTNARFVPHPLDPAGTRRVYLTGDRGRMRGDGTVEFMGRTDHQIKLRGYRIELGEIESVLEQHALVERAAVTLVHSDTDHAHLAAFVSLNNSLLDQKLPTDTRQLCSAIRSFAVEQLPGYKLPTALQILDAMPLTSSGKVDRKRLPNSADIPIPQEQPIAPRNALEQFLCGVWAESLGIESIGVNQNYFDAGGSSLQAAMLTGRLSTELGVHVPTALLFDLADISRVANRLVQLHPEEMKTRFGESCAAAPADVSLGTLARADLHPLLAELKPGTDGSPIFMVHPPGGIVVCYRELAAHLPANQALYGIRSRGLHGQEQLPESLEAMALEYLSAILSIQSEGPYIVGGWSLGGLVAYEMAQQLRAKGASVQLLLLDTTIPEGASPLVPAEEQVNVGLEYGINLSLDQLGELPPEEQLPFLWDHAKQLGVLSDDSPMEVVGRILRDLQNLFHHHVSLSRNYRIQPLDADISLFRPTEVPFELKVSKDRGWRYLAKSVSVHFVPGHHHSMVQEPHVGQLARLIDAECKF